ncbi:MAG: DNA topoisomerase IB [Pseudomonadota bacterium]
MAALDRAVERALPDPPAAAALASAPALPAGPCPVEGLRWSSDEQPGIRRLRQRAGFRYVGPDGAPVRDEPTLARIRKLAIPPAYEDVWICLRANGHIQATGRDARGRKQYRYHPDWRVARDADKFVRMAAFGAALPRIRKRVAQDLKAGDTPRPPAQAVLATIVKLLDETWMRIGNESYARENGSFGLTTLRNRHAKVKPGRIELRFRGKHGVQHSVGLDDPRVARIVRRCQNLPGQELFEYVDDDGSIKSIDSADVNAYLREASGEDFTAKDFRTWHATAYALQLMCAAHPEEPLKPTELLKQVAQRLGNTPAVCKKSYVHPELLSCQELGRLTAARLPRVAGLKEHERRLLAYLRSGERAARRVATRVAKKPQALT